MFKVTKEDDKHYLISHKDGHFIKIAKKGLSPDLEGHIKKMSKGGEVGNPKLQQSHVRQPDKVQHFDEGGTVQPEANQQQDFNFSPLPQEQYGPPSYLASDPIISPSNGAPKVVNPNSQKQKDGIPDWYGEAVSAQQQGNLATKQEGETLQKQNEANAIITQRYQNDIQAKADHVQALTQARDQEALKEQKDLLDQKLDFNRVWHDAGTGNKVLAGIGLVLGGMGAGITGGPNQASQMMNNIINRDIEQQKADVDKKKTLWSMNLQRYKDAQSADIMTMDTYKNIYNTKLQQMAYQSGSPLAVARANQEIAKNNIEMTAKKEQLFWGIANKQYGMQELGILPSVQGQGQAQPSPTGQPPSQNLNQMPQAPPNGKQSTNEAPEDVEERQIGTDIQRRFRMGEIAKQMNLPPPKEAIDEKMRDNSLQDLKGAATLKKLKRYVGDYNTELRGMMFAGQTPWNASRREDMKNNIKYLLNKYNTETNRTAEEPADKTAESLLLGRSFEPGAMGKMAGTLAGALAGSEFGPVGTVAGGLSGLAGAHMKVPLPETKYDEKLKEKAAKNLFQSHTFTNLNAIGYPMSIE